MKLFTIGYAQKSAERFFNLLKEHGVERVVDIRLHPDGQLAGFAKRADLRFFLPRLAGCEYHHCPLLSPTEEILSDYRKDHDWAKYTERFEALLDERNVPQSLDRRFFEEKVSCLLCSEAPPDKCHRRLVAERIAKHWPDVEVIHLR